MLRRLVVFIVLVVALAAAPAAHASELIDRNATAVHLAVDAHGRALVSYRVAGRERRVLAWGAVNAIAPTRARRQVAFRLDYSGGRGGFRGVCLPYKGPRLRWFVTACTAPDGSYWALQRWRRLLPNFGLAPAAPWELRLSHWTGPLAVLEIKLDWAYRRYDHLYGRYTYRGRPVHGFRSTPTGSPLDTFGRNLYVDTLDSAYGSGWRRENSFQTHYGSGGFCYGFYEHGGRPSGRGRRYRATIIGPGVTPDIVWHSNAPGPYDAARDRAANTEQHALFEGSSLCRPN